MSNIWHKLPEQPENGRDVIEKWHHLGIHYTHFIAKNGIAEDNPFTDAWCYLDDLLALETKNKDLSDKIGKLKTELDRTRKALDVAVKRLGYIKNNYKSWTPDRDKQMIAQAANDCIVGILESYMEFINIMESTLNCYAELPDKIEAMSKTLIAKRRNDWKPILEKAKKTQKAQKSAKKSA